MTNSTYKIAVSKYIVEQKLPPGDPNWRAFNSGFDNYQIEPQQVIEAVYQGRAITTQHKNHWRASENYVCGQHIGLDFDNGNQSSSIPILAKDPFISRYANFIYTTMSHTEEAPRSRVIFFLDAPIMQAKNYALAATALLWLFGGADRKCKDPVRFFYGSKGCQFHQVGQVLPLEKVKHMIDEYQETGRREKKKAAYYPPAEMQVVKSALDKIPPNSIEYDEWLSILMAIHAEYGEAGLPMAESWGDGYPNEIARKWASFHEKGNPQGAVTMGTLFNIAKRFGWERNIL